MPSTSNEAANARSATTPTDLTAPGSAVATAAGAGGTVSAAPVSVRRWPAETHLRCDEPEKLARFHFARGLVRGCDLDDDGKALVVRWRDPAAFYEHFSSILLESGVTLHEINAKGSALERAIEPPPLP